MSSLQTEHVQKAIIIYFFFLIFNVAKHINVECLFRNIHSSLQYVSCSLLTDHFCFAVFFFYIAQILSRLTTLMSRVTVVFHSVFLNIH